MMSAMNSQKPTPLNVSLPAPHAGRRRIAVVTETWPPEINGVAHTLSTLVKELAAMGDDVLVIRPRQRGDGREAGGWQECRVPGLPVPGYAGLRFGLPATGRVRRALSAFQPDAVYVATQGPLGWAAARAARKLGIRLVTGFHTNFQAYGRHYGAPRLEQAIWSWLRHFHSASALTLVPNEDQAAELTAAGFGPTARLERGVDNALFTPARRDPMLRAGWGVSDRDPVLLYVGRLAAEKNIALAVRCFENLQESYPCLRLLVVGDGPLASALRLRCPQAIFVGVRTGLDLARHYASADILLMPSLTETFGNVVLEGMASGLAVCTFDYAAGARHILDRECGLLAPFGDEMAFMDAVHLAVSDPILRRRYGRAARLRVARLDWTEVAYSFRSHLLGVDTVSQSPGMVPVEECLHG
jgi:glycosyltransferase involved in cell wall biosynthesis